MKQKPGFAYCRTVSNNSRCHCELGEHEENMLYRIEELEREKKGNERLSNCPTLLLDATFKFTDVKKALKDLLFCAARVRSATFRTINRKQFDEAVEQAEKTLKDIKKNRVKTDK